jgi:hypothetical protein
MKIQTSRNNVLLGIMQHALFLIKLLSPLDRTFYHITFAYYQLVLSYFHCLYYYEDLNEKDRFC